ncbi:MAG: nucleotidyltransferase domain-containing protein [bacterium]|nr:nucleotidyltransferase domain-containing protein [bacterium]
MNKKSITRALAELKRVLTDRFGSDIEIFLFGSVARNDYEPDSDIDVLVLFPGEVDTDLKEEVIGTAYDVELKHNVVFGTVARSKEYWMSEKAAGTPFRQNLQREALRI